MKESLLRSLLIIWLLFPIGGVAEQSFREIFVFGDSLSDTGNLASLPSPEVEFLNHPPYDRGFSNGPRAVEVLANSLGLSAKPSLHLIGPPAGTNFAVAGARAGGTEPFDLLVQLGAFLFSHQGNAPADALYIIIIGGNDLRDARDEPDTTAAAKIIQEAVHTIEESLRILVSRGARAILVSDAPDIGAIPETRLLAESQNDAQLIKSATEKTKDFNGALSRSLSNIEEDVGIDIIEFNLFQLVRFIRANNVALGFTNDRDACFSSITFTFHPECDFDEFVFFDEIHPTARVHERAGRALFTVVPEVPSVDLR